MSQPPIRVLFVSQRNSLRSLLAQACLNQMGAGRFLAFSCGSGVAPGQQLHPLVATALAAAGISADNLSSKGWNHYERGEGRRMRFVITLSDDLLSRSGPMWPGQPDTAQWSYPDLLDPARAQGVTPQEVQQTLYSLRRRIELLVSLPMRNVDAGDLRNDLRDLAYAG